MSDYNFTTNKIKTQISGSQRSTKFTVDLHAVNDGFDILAT